MVFSPSGQHAGPRFGSLLVCNPGGGPELRADGGAAYHPARTPWSNHRSRGSQGWQRSGDIGHRLRSPERETLTGYPYLGSGTGVGWLAPSWTITRTTWPTASPTWKRTGQVVSSGSWSFRRQRTRPHRPGARTPGRQGDEYGTIGRRLPCCATPVPMVGPWGRPRAEALRRLREYNVPVEYLSFEDEGHGMVQLANKLRAYPAVADFLNQHLQGANG